MVSLVNWTIAHFDPAMLVVENSGFESAKTLNDVVTAAGREAGVGLWSVVPETLHRAFGHPQLTSKHQLREVVRGLWPILNTRDVNQLVLDAVAAGLYAQTERLFAENAGESV